MLKNTGEKVAHCLRSILTRNSSHRSKLTLLFDFFVHDFTILTSLLVLHLYN